MPKTLPIEQREAVRDLLGSGLSDYEIARRTGVGRGTVQRWRRRGIPGGQRHPPIPTEIHPETWDPSRREAYAYLLGLYLGDGYIGTFSRTFSLLIACDGTYPGLVRMCSDCVSVFAPRPPTVRNVGDTNGVRVCSYWKAWPLFFPQHGPGSKLDRKIELVDWLQLKEGPKEYSYPRYFFTNYSADIQAIFCRTCDRLGIRWSRSNWRNISISHRTSVALLDEFIGPKQ